MTCRFKCSARCPNVANTPIPMNPMPSPLHHYAELARDALAIWGGLSLFFIAIGKLINWRNRHKEKRENRLRGAVDNAVNLARCKSSLRQLPVVGRIVCPMRAKATMHAQLGCKRLSCPARELAAVGTTREASKLGGLNIKE